MSTQVYFVKNENSVTICKTGDAGNPFSANKPDYFLKLKRSGAFAFKLSVLCILSIVLVFNSFSVKGQCTNTTQLPAATQVIPTNGQGLSITTAEKDYFAATVVANSPYVLADYSRATDLITVWGGSTGNGLGSSLGVYTATTQFQYFTSAATETTAWVDINRTSCSATNTSSTVIYAAELPSIPTMPSGTLCAGSTVTFTGTGLIDVNTVTFAGGGPPVVVSGNTATSFNVVIPAYAQSGQLVNIQDSIRTSSGTYLMGIGGNVPAGSITIGSANGYSSTPSGGAVGSAVTINGFNLSGATNVEVNGVAATNVSINSRGTQITLNVATGTTGTGNVTFTDACGNARTAGAFTVVVPTNYYYVGSGAANVLSSWSTVAPPATGGSAPPNFTNPGETFNITNGYSATLTAGWAITGAGSSVVVGDGSNASTLTIPSTSGYTITGGAPVSVLANSTLTISNTVLPVLGSLNSASTVVYNETAATTIPVSQAYGNLTISGTSTFSMAGAVTVNGNYLQSSGTVYFVTGISNLTDNFLGNFTVTAGTIDVESSTSATGIATIYIGGNFSNAGTITYGGDYVYYITFNNGNNSQTFSNTGTITACVFEVSDGADLQLATTLNFPTAGTGTYLTVDNGSELDLENHQVTFAATGYAVAINGAVETMSAGGLNGTTTSGFSSTNSPTISLASNSYVLYDGTAAQTVTARTDYGNIIVSNSAGASLAGTTTASGTLFLDAGNVILGSNNLTVSSTSGASSSNYVQTNGTGQLDQFVAGTAVAFPVGNAAYDPITLTNSGTSGTFGINEIDGTYSATGLDPAEVVNRRWQVTEGTAGGSLTVSAQYNNADGYGASYSTGISAVLMGLYNGASFTVNNATQSGSDPFTVTSNTNFSPATSGTQYFAIGEGDAFTFVPSVTLSANNVPAGSLIGSTTNNPIYSFGINPSGGESLTGLTIPTNGSGSNYVTADLTDLKAWYSATATFSSSTATLLSTLTSPGTPGTLTFPAFTAQAFTTATTGYIFITADVACGASPSDNITIGTITSANLTFAITPSGYSGATSAGNQESFIVNITAGTATGLTLTTATVPATLSSCSPTAYGVEYSTTNNFANGSGTSVAGSNLASGSFSVGLTGLTPAAVYYVHSYATVGGSTYYSAQGTFTTLTPCDATAPTAANVGNCGAGTVTLTATGGTGTQYNWWSAQSGGTLLSGSASSYTTPSISATTPYYVEAYNLNTQTSLAAATSASITYTAGSNDAQLFNITNNTSNPLVVSAISATYDEKSSSIATQVFYRTTTYVGNEQSSTGWNQVFTGNITTGTTRVPKLITLTTPITIPSGGVYGIYVYQASDGGYVYNGTSTTNDANITITAGSIVGGQSGPFGTGGTLYAGYSIYGLVYYSTECTSARTTAKAVIATGVASNSVTTQSAVAGAAVGTPPSVLVTDASGNPASNVTVTFAVSGGGGSVSPATVVTNSSGVATLTSWTLGTTAGTNTVTATTSCSLTGSPVTFTATGIPGPVTKFVWSPATIASATVGTSVSSGVTSISAEDANNNVCSSGTNTFSLTVTFAGTAGATGTSAAFTAGVLNTFPALTPTTAGSGKTITATNGSASGTLTLTTVAKGTPTITTPPTASAITYGQTLASSTLSGGSASVAGSFAFTTPSTAPAAGTASQSVTFTPTDAADYNTVTLNVSVTVNQATPTLSITGTPTSFTYTGSAQGPTVTVTNNSGGAQTYSYTSTDGGGYSAATAPTNAGAYQVTVSVAATSNYTAAGPSNAVAFTISKATPTLSITGTPTSFTYTGSAQGPTVTVTNNSGGAQTYSYTSTDGGGYSAATAPTNAGAYQVTVSVAATSNYTAAGPSNAVAFTINKATPTATLTVTNSPVTYNGSAQAAAVSVSSSSVSGTVSNVLYNGSATIPTAAGTYAVTANFVPSDGTDYSTLTGLSAGNFVISQATPTATLTVTNSPVTYNGSAQAAAVSVSSSSVSGTVSNVLYNGSATVPTAAGTYAVTANFVPTNSNYNTLTGLSAGNFVISQATPTATLTVTNSPQTYTGSAISAAVSISASSVAGSVSNVLYNGSATIPTAAGTYAVTANFVPSDGTDYSTLTGLSAGNFVISAAGSAITVTGSTAYTYNNTAQGPSTYTESGSTGAVTFSYAGTGATSYGPGATAPTAAGSYTATATVAADGNYNGAVSAPYAFTIAGAPLTVTGNNITKCNGATYTFSGTEFTATGLIAADGSSVSSVTLTSAGAAAGAAAGPYSITPSAATGTGLSNYVITYSTAGVLTVETPVVITMIQTNPDCNVSTGSLSSTVTGGVSPYTYKLNTGLNYNPSGSFVSTPLFSGLAAGYYAYGAEDANGCVATATGLTLAPLTEEPILINNVAAPSTVAVCYGSSVTIETTVYGGNGPYTYSLNGGTPVSAGNRYFAAYAGANTITVTDANGCTYTTNTVTVTQPSSALALSTTVTNLNCINTTGTITVTAAGGYSSSYSYSANGGSSYQSGNSFTGLAAQSYSLSVKDANGCTATGTASVINNVLTTSAITVSGTGNTQICYGSTVTITTTPSGGTAPYTYSLDGTAYVSSSGRYFGVVGAGSHYITVKDANGCTATTGTVTLTQPSSALSLSVATTSPACASGSGTITMTASGGYSSSYSYSDNGGSSYQSTGSFTGLAAGTYSLDLQDANGCFATNTATVKAPTMTAAAITGNLNACYGANTTISTTGSGGVSPYTYSLNGGTPVAAGSRYFSVGGGMYAITVIDANGCTYTTPSVTVVQPSAAVTFTAVQGGSGCTGNAGIAVTASGGYGGYSYSDNGGSSYQSGSVFTGLGYGSYTVAVKDMNGCASASAAVKLTALTTSAIQGNTVICPAGGSTTISTVPSGGASPYSYSLDGGTYVPSNQRYFYVTAGAHTITVEDNQGCTASASATVTNCAGEPQAPTADVNGKTVTATGAEFEAKVSPNPAAGAFHLQLSSSDRTNGVELIITDMAGRKMYETKGTADQTYEFGSEFTSGMYILQIRQGNTLHTVKLIKGN